MSAFWFVLGGFLLVGIALLIALFIVGIKMRVPIGDWRWSVPLRLATISMVLPILGIVIAASIVLHGISAAPLMELSRARRARGRPEVALSDKR